MSCTGEFNADLPKVEIGLPVSEDVTPEDIARFTRLEGFNEVVKVLSRLSSRSDKEIVIRSLVTFYGL